MSETIEYLDKEGINLILELLSEKADSSSVDEVIDKVNFEVMTEEEASTLYNSIYNELAENDEDPLNNFLPLET